MTYDIDIMNPKTKKHISSVNAIHGLGYGTHFLDFAQKYIFSDKLLTPNQVKISAKKFHKEFSKFALTLQVDGVSSKSFIGSDPTGYYYNHKKINEDLINKFKSSLRLLNVYMTAAMLGYSIEFH